MTKKEKLKDLEEGMKKDDSLPLRKGATKLVFGVGEEDTKALFIGEGPGYWEDQKGEPFVGRAGKFLDALLSSINLSREEVYITNVVHHRPPGNRDPFDEELLAYGAYLDKMIEIINPKVIVTLGRFSMGKFLPGVKISGVHGRVHTVNWKGKEITIVPMYHPAAGLRNPQIKDQTIIDFKVLPEILEEVNKVEVEQMQII